ncbi:MAG: pyruvate kinase [Candidatus Nomurabacteria bacterium]|nr:pyruvate kinase [Candidatus Nomurabacteria bacterium]
MNGKLIIARHEESEWNKLGKWTGSVNIGLTGEGFNQSRKMGELIRGIPMDQAFASAQIRSLETLLCMEDDICIDLPITRSDALNERDYGDYTGKNKWEMKDILGEEEFDKLRRDWDYSVPNGETLKMVYERIVPYYLNTILPILKEGKTVLLVAHGNSLRALMKYLENISDENISHLEMLFDTVVIYEINEEGKMVSKEERHLPAIKNDTKKVAQIVATIGINSGNRETLLELFKNGMNIARLNFSWSSLDWHAEKIALIKASAKEAGKNILIIQDLPGPRIQEEHGHTYDKTTTFDMTEQDKNFVKFGVEQEVDYTALSFVGSKKEILECRELIKSLGGTQKIIAKVERKIAVDNLEEIISSADAVMVARGDLGDEFPLEQVPFIQDKIIKACNKAGKPVITATQMMLSMTNSPTPTRAEVTDVYSAISQGSDAVMLSEETATGKYPVEAVTMMEKIILEAESHMTSDKKLNLL